MDFILRVRTAQRSIVLYHDIIALPTKNTEKYEVFFAPCGGDFFMQKKFKALITQGLFYQLEIKVPALYIRLNNFHLA